VNTKQIMEKRINNVFCISKYTRKYKWLNGFSGLCD
jgi:hypothetical protein